MVTIIHGDDIVLSRKYLQEQKQNSISPYVFDGIIDLSTIVQITQGSGLFSTEKNIFVENFFSKNKLTHSRHSAELSRSPSSGLMLSPSVLSSGSKDKAEALNSPEAKSIINYINKNELLFNLFFWEGNLLQKKSIALFTNPSVKTFKIPQAIFLFLDSIKPADYRDMINLFHNALKNTLEQLVFFMLQRQFRLLLAISDESSKETIDEALRLAPWQKGKIERQARLFSIGQLKDIYKRLYKIELAQKTGNLPYSLTCAVDFLLLGI